VHRQVGRRLCLELHEAAVRAVLSRPGGLGVREDDMPELVERRAQWVGSYRVDGDLPAAAVSVGVPVEQAKRHPPDLELVERRLKVPLGDLDWRQLLALGLAICEQAPHWLELRQLLRLALVVELVFQSDGDGPDDLLGTAALEHLTAYRLPALVCRNWLSYTLHE
jgi:hypothetical protein